MPSAYKFHMVPISSITVEDRQRKDVGNISSLADSILRHGLIHPVVITRFGKLVAGERRLRAIQSLGSTFPQFPNIPVHFFEELDEFELKAIELEENLRREDLTWQDECDAYLSYHETRCSQDSEWTIDITADALGVSSRTISRNISIAKELRAGNPLILKCETASAAANILDRKRQRAVDSELADMARVGGGITLLKTDISSPSDEDVSKVEPEVQPSSFLRPAEEDIKVANFIEWAATYRDAPFNLIHCDFPYGINYDQSDQARSSHKPDEMYSDTESTYFTLIDAFLTHQDRFASPSCHVLFWFSMKYYSQTKTAFEESGWTVNPMPLIWYRSDMSGILPDPRRGPRQVYETCFLMNRGDRKITSAVANVAAVPAKRNLARHPSEKPIPVLTQFFSMLVDSSTRFLDPTCGSGTSLYAASYHGASSVFGMDLNPVHVETAVNLLNRFRLSPRAAVNAIDASFSDESNND